MTAVTEPDKSATEPRAAGLFTKLLSKAFTHMTPAERTDLMQDAAALTSTELGKADDALAKTDNFMTVDTASTGFIEDHWSDSPSDVLRTSSAHGPSSSVPGGTVNVGPSQEASGNGGLRMERQYSQHAPQTGLMSATEKLGRDLVGLRGAMKSILKAMDAFGRQIEILKAAAPVPPDATVLQSLVDSAVSKAIAPVKAELHKALRTATVSKSDDGEDDEEAKAASLLAKADDEKKEKERDGEDEDDKSESAKSAAELRLMAKARIDHAKLRMAKALDYAAEDKGKAAQRAMSLAEINIAKAQSHLDEAVALRDGKAGLSTQLISRDIAKAKKGVGAAQSANQDIWPCTTETSVGKADTDGSAAKAADPPARSGLTPTSPDLAKAIEQIQEAAKGMGMMTASVGDLFNVLSGQAKTPEVVVDNERRNLPPVFALAKAGASELATREAELARLRDANTISFEDHDRARDALTRVRMGLPEETIKAMVDRLPDAARAVLTRAA